MSACPESYCDDTFFSRNVCPEPCGAMHNYCNHCADRLDPCELEESDALDCAD